MKEAFLNKTINYMNIHFGLQRFAEILAHTFGPLYLYKTGIPVYFIFIIFGGVFFIRFFIRPFMLFILPKIGLKKSIIFGSMLYFIIYPILSLITELSFFILLPLFLLAIVEISYWLPYHTYFGMVGDEKIRGRQSGIREAFLQIGGIVAPVLGGILMQYYGYIGTATFAAIFFILALIPLFLIEDIKPPKAFSFKEGWNQTKKRGMILYASNAFIYATFHFSWIFVLYFLMGENTISTGGLISLAIIIQIIISYLVGYSIDLKKEKHFYIFGGILSAIGIIGKTLFAIDVASILLMEVFVMLSIALVLPYINVITYNELQKSPQPLWYQFLAESGWDIGSMFGFGSIATFIYFGGEIRYGMLFALLSLPFLIWGLSPWYKK